MKRHGNLYVMATSPEALYQGYLDARRGKRGSAAVYHFERRIGAEIADLAGGLAAGRYRPSPPREFQVTEPKPRLIQAPAFRDRVVQHAVYNVVRPLFDRTFIGTSFACRKGLGTHAAGDYLQRALAASPRDSYILQLDVRRFYYSIDRDILRGLVERHIKDGRMVDLMMLFAVTRDPVGLPIGNLMSQLLALVYLNPVDQYIKRDLQVRHYCRYVDDLALVGLTRDHALDCKRAIADELGGLRLSLSKSRIARVSRGANYVGYRTWSRIRFVRKRALYNYRRHLARGNVTEAAALLAHARHTGSHRHMVQLAQDRNPELYAQLPRTLL